MGEGEAGWSVCNMTIYNSTRSPSFEVLLSGREKNPPDSTPWPVKTGAGNKRGGRGETPASTAYAVPGPLVGLARE